MDKKKYLNARFDVFIGGLTASVCVLEVTLASAVDSTKAGFKAYPC